MINEIPQFKGTMTQLKKLVAQAKKLKDKYGDMEDRNDDSAKYETNVDDYWETQLKGEE